MSSPSKVELIVEDTQHLSVFLQLLALIGVNSRAIHTAAAPKGKGSAKQWVFQEAVKYIPTIRSRNSRASTAAVIVVDGDGDSRLDVFKQINKALESAGQSPMKAEDPVFVFVPRMNIETWIHFANGTAVEETQTYAKFSGEQSEATKILIKKLEEPVLRKTKLGDAAPASLVEAVESISKIRELAR